MRAFLLSLAACLVAAPAFAASAGGPYALALAALVAERNAHLSATDRYVVAALFSGNERVYFPPGRRIVVKAASVVCRVSDVQITARSCQLKFGRGTVNLSGGAANALFASLAAAGVRSEGAAGSIYESVSALGCTVTPSVVKQNGGGGASCSFTPG